MFSAVRVMDVTDLSAYPNGYFDCAIDKATLDAILVGEFSQACVRILKCSCIFPFLVWRIQYDPCCSNAKRSVSSFKVFSKISPLFDCQCITVLFS